MPLLSSSLCLGYEKRLFLLLKRRVRFYSTDIPYNLLRPYQKECIQTCLDELDRGCRKQVVSLPVGSGKTVIMSNLIPLIPNPTPKATKVLLLAHRVELLDQAHNQITKYNSDLVVHVEQGKRKVDIDTADVIVASVPTLGRKNSSKIESYDKNLFKAILIDEAHHAVASTYMNILDHFGADDPDSKMLVWGCSATVRRHDGLRLSDIFDKITYHVDFLNMIEEGYLSQMRVTTVNTHVDLNKVGHCKNDFILKELSQAVNIDARNEVIISSWRKLAHQQGRKSTLVFAVDVAHTVRLCNAFLDAGIEASFITGTTPTATRQQTLQDFRDGKIPVLVNCAILTEGTDIPRVDCVLLTRPTKSNTLFQQMFGRGLRLYPGKENCLLIDFVDNFHRSGSDGIVTVPTLLGLSSKEIIEDEDILSLEKEAQHEKLMMAQAEKELEQLRQESKNDSGSEKDLSLVKIKFTEYDSINEILTELYGYTKLRAASPYGWVDIGPDKCILSIFKKGHLILTRNQDKIWSGSFQFGHGSSRGKPFAIPLEADDLALAIRAADTWATNKFGHLARVMSRKASFRNHPMTEAQMKALKQYKIEIQQQMTKGQAMDLLTKLKFGQLKIWKTQIKMKEKERKFEKKMMKEAVLRREDVKEYVDDVDMQTTVQVQ